MQLSRISKIVIKLVQIFFLISDFFIICRHVTDNANCNKFKGVRNPLKYTNYHLCCFVTTNLNSTAVH